MALLCPPNSSAVVTANTLSFSPNMSADEWINTPLFGGVGGQALWNKEASSQIKTIHDLYMTDTWLILQVFAVQFARV